MRSQSDQMILHQISIELNKLNSIMTDEEEKPAIIQRIADLKAMLDTPAKTEAKSLPSFRELAADFVQAYRNRHS